MKIPKITLKMAEQAVKEHSFKLDKKVCSKKRAKKANKFEKKHGFRLEDSWNLDNSIACFILPRLLYLRENTIGIPGTLVIELGDGGKEAWDEILKTMIYGFYLYITKEDYDFTEEEKEIWKRTKELFVEYFESLWY